MSKIPKVAKFRGDNKQSWISWIAEFEAHCKAIGVDDARSKEVLLVSTESTAFSFLSQKMADDNAVTYANLKIEMKRRFYGEDYRRGLQNKYRAMVFKKGTEINEFVDKLTKTIKEIKKVPHL